MEAKMAAAIKKMKEKTANNTKEDENILSIYLKEINKIPLLTREEEDRYARAAAKGDTRAKEKLIRANLRFVVNVAKKYQNQGLPISDLISEGNIGLMNAIERYDVNRGYHFISYAVWWIRQAILKAICEKSRMIRIPLNRANELVQIEKARKTLQSEQGTDPEIKDSSMVGDFIENTDYMSPDDIIIEKSLREDINNILQTLSEKESEILQYRFGLNGRRPMSLKEIGDKYMLTKERIRQIEKKALKRLQHPIRSQYLKSYISN
jgi:RNA polymerase primary sigma factor